MQCQPYTWKTSNSRLFLKTWNLSFSRTKFSTSLGLFTGAKQGFVPLNSSLVCRIHWVLCIPHIQTTLVQCQAYTFFLREVSAIHLNNKRTIRATLTSNTPHWTPWLTFMMGFFYSKTIGDLWFSIDKMLCTKVELKKLRHSWTVQELRALEATQHFGRTTEPHPKK